MFGATNVVPPAAMNAPIAIGNHPREVEVGSIELLPIPPTAVYRRVSHSASQGGTPALRANGGDTSAISLERVEASSWCHECHRDAVRAWRRRNRDRENAHRRVAYARR
jgi:hypothetical protein